MASGTICVEPTGVRSSSACVVFGEEFQVLEQVSVQLSLGQGAVRGVVIAKCLEFDVDVVVFGFFLQHFPGL